MKTRMMLLAAATMLAACAAVAQPSASTKPANDPTFRLINGADKAITEVFATPAGP